ncbi:MAG: hypothetical protein R2710_10910 [Acidimicrobiales bacterium]
MSSSTASATIAGDLGGHPEARVQRHHVVGRGGDHAGDVLLAGALGLPDLRSVVPHVVGGEDAGNVGGPRPHELGPRHHGAQHVTATPVVSDEVDRPVDLLELTEQPVDVLESGGAETLGDRGAESEVTGRRCRRRRAANSGPQMALVSGFPWTKTAGMAAR